LQTEDPFPMKPFPCSSSLMLSFFRPGLAR
jgi:hypothetical protein